MIQVRVVQQKNIVLLLGSINRICGSRDGLADPNFNNVKRLFDAKSIPLLLFPRQQTRNKP